jgi:hypothetical protein
MLKNLKKMSKRGGWKKMIIEVEKKLFIFLIIASITISLFAGLAIGQAMQPNDFSEQQKDFILNVGYSAGFCERLGLQSYLIINTTEEGLEYGVPICAEKTSDLNG